MDYIHSWELPHVSVALKLAQERAAAERLASAHIAASRIQRYAIIAFREREENHRAVEKKTDAQGRTVDPTPDDRLVEIGTGDSGPTGTADTEWNSNLAGEARGTFD